MVKNEYAQKTMLIGIIIILAMFSFLIAKPFLITILSSMILAYIFNPVHNKLKKILKNANLSAGIISFVIFLAILIPVWFLTPLLVRQTFSIYLTIQKVDFVSPLMEIAPKFFTSPEFTRDFTVSLNGIIIKIANSIMARFESIIANLPLILTQIVVLFFVFFFTLRDGDKISLFLKEMSPFNEETEKKFAKQFNDITKSVIYGLVVVGTIQGIAAGIGFYAFGVSQALFLTIIAIFFGILPILGPFMLWLPIGIGMVISGKVSIAIGFMLYNILTTLIVNFFISPKIIEKRSGMPQVIAIIGMLGGSYLFGIIGLIVGPLILGYLLIFLEFFRNKKIHEIFSLCE